LIGVLMRVDRVDISKFRGVGSTSLLSCGALNVLIGKNNSGKSTLLDAIDAFFAIVSSGSLVTGGTGHLGREIDFHKGDENPKPINISIDFSLDNIERQQIIDDIVAEAPQMKYALEDVDETDQLRATVSSIKHSSQFAYVSEISLVREVGLATGSHQNRVLLSVSSDVALELLQRKERIQRAERQAAEVLEIGMRIDPEDYQMLRREYRSTSERPTSARVNRRLLALSPESSFDLDSLIRHSDGYGEFRSQLQAWATSEENSARREATEPLKHPVDTFSGEAQELPQYAPQILKRIGDMTLLHLRDRREPVGREEAQRLLSLKTRRKGPEVLRNIQETVHSLLGVSIDAFESERESSRLNDVRAEMDVDEVLVEMNGAGIREALRLILDNELQTPQLLLVEEPEVHLHPALELSMLRYLKSVSSRAQIFVTTHSTNFLDTSEMRNVYLTRRDPWVSASLLDYEQAETAIPDELGLRLSSLFMYDRLVFVEGASDEAVLRELAPLVGVNFGQTNVGFVVMGSARNFTHYASQATIDLLTKRQVKTSFILDRDEASEEEVAALVDRLGAIAQTHVLKKREIENYLIVPRALCEFIREKKRMQNASEEEVSETEVAEKLEECTEALRRLTVEKRVLRALCGPVFFDRSIITERDTDADFDSSLASEIDRQIAALNARKTEIQMLEQREQEDVTKVWDANKLSLVPGDELLDCVCQKFGVRFKKRRDGARLARLLTAGELDPELARLLRDLVR
jgi:putative ATP-dependent endonuclease of the OLD family